MRRDPKRSRLAWLAVAVLAAATSFALLPFVSAMSDPLEDTFSELRHRMVTDQIERRGVVQVEVVEAMREVPRHLFVPESFRDRAYLDGPQPIGSNQTISQPYIVALMTAHLELDGDERVLEIGTGSGYQAAILSRLAREVYSIEIRPGLARKAESVLTDLGYDNVKIRIGDGYEGWPEETPFDGIMVTAAPEQVPEKLIDQLKVGARMVIPVGTYFQDLLVITKTENAVHTRHVTGVRFVPMVSETEEGG